MSALIQAQQAISAGDLGLARGVLETHVRQDPQDPDGLYLLGVCEQASGNGDAAQALYDRVLGASADHFGAHYNLALLLSSNGQDAEALPHHDAAVRLQPKQAWAYVNRGNARAALKQYEAAVADYDQALSLNPALSEAHTNKGNAVFALGRHSEAMACHEHAVQLAPTSAAAWIGMGRAAVGLNRLEDIRRCAEQALKLAPNNADACCLQGIALSEARLFEEAISSFVRALSIKPDHAEAWSNQGGSLTALVRLDEALACHQRAVELRPSDAQAWVGLGATLHEMERYSDAKACYQKALALNPVDPEAYSNMGSTCVELGQGEAAQGWYEKAVSLQPDHPGANWNLSQLLIARSDYTEGWRRFESRWDFKKLNLKRLQTNRPRWNGNPGDQPILLWGEQGIGDHILFGGILPDLINLPQRKLVALDRRLLALFERSMDGLEFIDVDQVSDVLPFAQHLPLGSLPALYRTSQASVKRERHSYLIADPVRTTGLRETIRKPGKIIVGVSWTSNRKRIGSPKSIQLEAMLMALASDRFHFVDLQYGDTSLERQLLTARHGIEVQHVDEIDNYDDVDGLAALIQACDIVVTTSNTTAHLAGALGKETLLLLPLGKGRLWYWSESDGRNRWYPSIRSFAQASPGDWSRPLAATKAALDAV